MINTTKMPEEKTEAQLQEDLLHAAASSWEDLPVVYQRVCVSTMRAMHAQMVHSRPLGISSLISSGEPEKLAKYAAIMSEVLVLKLINRTDAEVEARKAREVPRG